MSFHNRVSQLLVQKRTLARTLCIRQKGRRDAAYLQKNFVDEDLGELIGGART